MTDARCPTDPSHATSIEGVHALPLMHAATSDRINARLLADALGLELYTVADLIERPYRTVKRTPDAAASQGALRPLAEIARLLYGLYGDNTAAVRTWLNAPHPELEGLCPLDAMRQRRVAAVRTVLEIAVAELPV